MGGRRAACCSLRFVLSLWCMAQGKSGLGRAAGIKAISWSRSEREVSHSLASWPADAASALHYREPVNHGHVRFHDPALAKDASVTAEIGLVQGQSGAEPEVLAEDSSEGGAWRHLDAATDAREGGASLLDSSRRRRDSLSALERHVKGQLSLSSSSCPQSCFPLS